MNKIARWFHSKMADTGTKGYFIPTLPYEMEPNWGHLTLESCQQGLASETAELFDRWELHHEEEGLKVLKPYPSL